MPCRFALTFDARFMQCRESREVPTSAYGPTRSCDTLVLRLCESNLDEQDMQLRDTVHDHFEVLRKHDDPVEQVVDEYSKPDRGSTTK